MQDQNLETLIHEMLARQNRLMIQKILPELERLARVDARHENELMQLRIAIKELTDDYFERMASRGSDVRAD
jgi:hypothetical protein